MGFYTWIQQEMPQLIISTYREECGWDNTACIVNEQLVFRFAKEKKLRVQIKKEERLLKSLQPLLLQKGINVPLYRMISMKWSVVRMKWCRGSLWIESFLTH